MLNCATSAETSPLHAQFCILHSSWREAEVYDEISSEDAEKKGGATSDHVKGNRALLNSPSRSSGGGEKTASIINGNKPHSQLLTKKRIKVSCALASSQRHCRRSLLYAENDNVSGKECRDWN